MIELFPHCMEPTDLGALVVKTAVHFGERHRHRILLVEGAEDLPIAAVDASMLRRALDDMLDDASNCFDATCPIRLTARVEGTDVVFQIADEGIGIDPGHLDHDFTPFFRSDRSRTRSTGGVGIGLALARRVVRGHGGDIRLESQAGVGTAIRFTIPWVRVSEG